MAICTRISRPIWHPNWMKWRVLSLNRSDNHQPDNVGASLNHHRISGPIETRVPKVSNYQNTTTGRYIICRMCHITFACATRSKVIGINQVTNVEMISLSVIWIGPWVSHTLVISLSFRYYCVINQIDLSRTFAAFVDLGVFCFVTFALHCSGPQFNGPDESMPMCVCVCVREGIFWGPESRDLAAKPATHTLKKHCRCSIFLIDWIITWKLSN